MFSEHIRSIILIDLFDMIKAFHSGKLQALNIKVNDLIQQLRISISKLHFKTSFSSKYTNY